MEVQEQTLQKISDEIHDNISLTITLAKLHLNTYLMNIHEPPPENIKTSIDLIGKSLIDLNDLSKSLDAETVEKYGLLHAIEMESDLIRKSLKMDMHVTISGEPVHFDPSRELLALRIIQESFNNMLKHARAANGYLIIEYQTDALHLSIHDDGKGYDPEEVRNRKTGKVSSGLRNIRNRARMLNAEIEIASTPGQGSSINLKIPYRETYE